MDLQERNRAALAAVEERRDEFYEGILDLERAIAEPAGDDAVAWAADTAAAVEAHAPRARRPHPGDRGSGQLLRRRRGALAAPRERGAPPPGRAPAARGERRRARARARRP